MGQADELTNRAQAPAGSWPVLDRPPIVEVVCGFVFEPLPLDGLMLGVYWDQRKADYPSHSLQPAVLDGAVIVLGATMGRAMLESADGAHLLQVQPDRIYVNWRARGGEYPRFSPQPEGAGLLQRALAEYGRFAAFCEARAGARPTLRRVEVLKIDILRRGEVWTDVDDLAELVPITGTFSGPRPTQRRELGLRFVEHHEGEDVIVAIASVLGGTEGEMTALRIETRVVRLLPEGSSAEAALRAANATANEVFFRLIQRVERFGSPEGRST
jgi:hypothetical protein